MTDSKLTEQMFKQQLDEYRLEALLGEGGMACVYRGFDVRLKRPAAIKVIRAPFRAKADYIARFEREAQAIAQLRHPHIVGIYRYGEMDSLLYIAMEYIEGVDLEVVLADYSAKEEFIPPERASRITRQLGQALDYAHSKGVIHRDIKPSNIMLDGQGNTILTDFGLVLVDDNTRGEIFGTPYYIAPEQAISSAKAVPQSDLYAVGVILYEMFTAKLPFNASHPYDVALMHVSEPPPPPCTLRPDLSPEVEAVILKALAKKPDQRYPTGVALANALDQALFGKRSSSPRTGRSFSENIARLASSSRKHAPQENSPGPDSLPAMPAAVVAQTPSGAREGKVMGRRYKMRNIQSLLLALTADFTEEELRQLYIDLPEFKPVHQQLVQSRGKGEIVRRMLEYADQTLQVDDLLALAKEHNPDIYKRYEPYYESTTSSRKGLTGTMLGKYSVIEPLGRGGMAEVYKAFQPGLARYVAIKVIHDHLVDDEEFLERFESEAMAVSNLRHPHIVQVFDFDRDENCYYMVMEFIDGPTLESIIKDYRDKNQFFPLDEALKIFKALADAIDHAHSRGLIHRDLKPSNILFTPRERLVLTDFGIARINNVPSYTTANAIVGTPAYMAPEQAKGEPVTIQSDIYSMGVILYELATGHLPFEGDTPLAIILKLVDGTPLLPTQFNPDLPSAVEQVILKAIHRFPSERYNNAGELVQALEAAISEDPKALALSQLEPALKHEKPGDKPNPGQDPDATMLLQLEDIPLPGGKGLQKAGIPAVKINPRPIEPVTSEPRPGEGPGGSTINISGNTGQLIFGGGHVVQFGNITGGQVTIGPGAVPAASQRPNPEELFARLTTRLLVEAPPGKKEAALERLAELKEALATVPPDQQTIGYIRNWFTKNVPSLAGEVAQLGA
jgi:serine/threonine protein kinase